MFCKLCFFTRKLQNCKIQKLNFGEFCLCWKVSFIFTEFTHIIRPIPKGTFSQNQHNGNQHYSNFGILSLYDSKFTDSPKIFKDVNSHKIYSMIHLGTENQIQNREYIHQDILHKRIVMTDAMYQINETLFGMLRQTEPQLPIWSVCFCDKSHRLIATHHSSVRHFGLTMQSLRYRQLLFAGYLSVCIGDRLVGKIGYRHEMNRIDNKWQRIRTPCHLEIENCQF